MSDPVKNFCALAAEIQQSAAAAGRAGDTVKLLAVSKTRPAEEISLLYDAGVREFGENREPELAAKAAALPPDIIWHFIGPLQSNKVRKVVKLASVIHSVESISLIERIDRIAGEEGKTPRFLLEVNVSGETSKGGFAPDELEDAVKLAVSCRYAVCCGFMTMAPLTAGHDELMTIFSTLRDIRDRYAAKYDAAHFTELSMGMSGDFHEAVACGATIVRIGTAIFS